MTDPQSATGTDSRPEHGYNSNVDAGELGKFARMADSWWDPNGEFRPLHQMNPVRSNYIDQHAPLPGRTVLDIGCGGGLLCESMTQRGARVTGIDLGDQVLTVARLHAREQGLEIEYRLIDAGVLAQEQPASFDTVTCLEVLEHVPDPAALIGHCAALVRPGGSVFFSTLNRTAKAYALAIIGAEYIARWLPRGTHEYDRFIRPSELDAAGRQHGLQLQDLCGMGYDPLARSFRLTPGDVSVNYIAHFIRLA